ncbi:MAG: polyprenyl diphosphate synthase, partial [Cyanophyceae cyanobacterium]
MSATSTALRQLPADLNRDALPKHVAVIMDGNGRWAQKRKLPRMMGHHRGADTLHDLVLCCKDWGIKSLTVYAFSTENWRRPEKEVNFLMLLIEQMLRREMRFMEEEKVRLRVVGNVEVLPKALRKEVEESMERTAHFNSLNFNVATNYGGRQEILQACQAIATQVRAGHLAPEEITAQHFEEMLNTAR